MAIPEDIDRICQMIEMFEAHLDEGGDYDHRNVQEIARMAVRVARYMRDLQHRHEKLRRNAGSVARQYASLIRFHARQEPHLLKILELHLDGDDAAADDLFDRLNGLPGAAKPD
ncbi:hypothetical protein [Maricaulis sp.]|uniref:hypothetical protein n=1 Tax=Maricaulis sp. TaxID=1486257 RepID=UPI0032996843